MTQYPAIQPHLRRIWDVADRMRGATFTDQECAELRKACRRLENQILLSWEPETTADGWAERENS